CGQQLRVQVAGRFRQPQQWASHKRDHRRRNRLFESAFESHQVWRLRKRNRLHGQLHFQCFTLTSLSFWESGKPWEKPVRWRNIGCRKCYFRVSDNRFQPHERFHPMKKFLHSRDGAPKGAALIIVLALVVLATGLSLAYFTRTTTDRQLAQSS